MALRETFGELGFGQSAPPLGAGGDVLVVPDAQLLFTAEYSRLGDDLLLTGGDGARQVITGYFASDSPPVLASPGGAILTPEVVAQLVGPRAPGQYAQAGTVEGPVPIGQVEAVTGSAQVIRAGLPVRLEPGDPVFQNDVVQTGLASDLVIGFADGTIFSLSANARLVLDGMVYDPAGSSNSLSLSVIHGVFSFITGQVAPTGGIEVNTPVATLGIRGTTVHGILESIAGPLTVFLGRTQVGSAARIVLVDPLTGVPIASLDNLDLAYSLSSIGARPLLRALTASEQEFGMRRAELIHGVQSTFDFRYDSGEPIVQPGETLRTQAGPNQPSGGIGFDREFGAGEGLEGGLLQGLEGSPTLALLEGVPSTRRALANGPKNFASATVLATVGARVELAEANATTGAGTTSSGQIVLTGGTTPVQSLALVGLTFMAGGAPLSLTSGGLAVTVVQSDNQAQGFAGGVPVFLFRLNPDGSFTFSLFRPLDHPIAGATGTSDTIDVGFDIVVTFTDGTALQTSILSVVLDSGPVAASEAAAVSEASGLGVPVTGNLPILGGGDGVKSVELIGQSAALSAGGQPVSLVRVSDDTFLGLAADGAEIFRMTFDAATGDYAFTLLRPIDHGRAGADSFDLVFRVAVTDGDNDSVISTITIAALDDIPAVGANAPVSVQENALPDSGGTVASGTLAFVAGADGARIVALALGGQAGVLQGDDLVISGTFFELRVDTLSGAYVYILNDSTPAHAAGEPLVQSFAYTVRDGDGDAAVGFLQVRIDDDEPSILDGGEGGIRLVHDESPGEQNGMPATPIDDNDDDDVSAAVVEDQVEDAEAAVDALLAVTDTDLTAIGGVQDTLDEGVAFDAGADGLKEIRFDLSAGGIETGDDSGLLRSSDDKAVTYVVAGPGLILGVVDFASGDEFGDVVFSLHLATTSTAPGAGSGLFTFVQYQAVEHPLAGDGITPAGSHDEGLPFAVDDVDARLSINYVVVDNDGDTAVALGDAAIVVDIEDDGPSIALGSQKFTMINDETPGVDADSDDVDFDPSNPSTPDTSDDATIPDAITGLGIGGRVVNASKKLVDFKYGADGPGTDGGTALDDVVNGTDTGLVDTATGRGIFLFNGADDTVVGLVVPEDVDPEAPAQFDAWVASIDLIGTPASIGDRDVAFVSVLEETGTPNGAPNGNESTADLWFVQYRAIEHDNPFDPDEANPEPAGVLFTDTITFETLAAGTLVTQVFGEHGSGPILVEGLNPDLGAGVNAAMIFDSRHPTGTSGPTGIDFDLGTPNENFGGPGVGTGGESGPFANDTGLGNVLIVSENLDQDNPNDEGTPGTNLSFDFSAIGPVTLDAITIIDIERFENTTVSLFDGGGALLGVFTAPVVGDNGVGVLSLGNTAGVVRMEVLLNGSGAIDNIVFTRTVDFADEFLNLGYTVTDADGDTAAGTATITIEDDGPSANNDAAVYLGAGTELFILRPGDGGAALAEADLITDFEDGVDQLGLDAITAADVTAGGDETGDAMISSSLGGGILAAIVGVDPLDITTDDFLNVI